MQQIVRELTERIAFTLWPEGGQGRARRNAWRAMVDDNARARLRAEAATAVEAAAAVDAAAATARGEAAAGG